MTQTVLFILVIAIGLYYAYKYVNKAEKDIQKNNQKSNEKIPSTMVLWEEDYLMVEIMSSKNLDFAKKQIGEVTDSSEIIKIETKELGISKTELTDLLINAEVNEYEKISYVGIGEPHVLENPKSRAFGSLTSAIFFEGETDKVENIWLSSFNWPEINKTNIVNGLNEIGKKYDMILVDNYPIQNKIVNLKDKIEIQNYLDIYIERYSKK